MRAEAPVRSLYFKKGEKATNFVTVEDSGARKVDLQGLLSSDQGLSQLLAMRKLQALASPEADYVISAAKAYAEGLREAFSLAVAEAHTRGKAEFSYPAGVRYLVQIVDDRMAVTPVTP